MEISIAGAKWSGRRLVAETRGSHAVEYTVALAFVALAAIAGTSVFGGAVDAKAREKGDCVARLDCDGTNGGDADGGEPLDTQRSALRAGASHGPPLTRAWDAIYDASYDLVGGERITLTRVDFQRVVPESAGQLFEHMSKLAKNKNHVKGITANEVASTIEIKLSRMAHMAGNSDFAIPIAPGKLDEAKKLIDKLMADGYTPTQADADALYALIDRGQPKVTKI